MDIKRLEHEIGQTLTLEAVDSWPETKHVVDEKSIYAMVAAEASGRPLLVRGEPGVGKSQLARAWAHLRQRHLISFVVQPASEYQDLLWTFDHVARLGEAQLLASVPGELCARPERTDETSPLHPRHFINPGPLWWALNWKEADDQKGTCGFRPEKTGAEPPSPNGAVLLIDEIDKADIDLPNGLLEVLGNGAFSVPYLKNTVRASGPAPLVLITSNNQRELPPAFLRRCVVLDLELPSGEALKGHFLKVGMAHFPEMDPDVILEAVEQTLEDRGQGEEGRQQVGQAEFLDLLRALKEVANSKDEQLGYLKKLRPYILQKHSDQPGN